MPVMTSLVLAEPGSGQSEDESKTKHLGGEEQQQ
jgi:hypothetical protein